MKDLHFLRLCTG